MLDTPRNRVIEAITSSAKHRPPLLPPDPDLFKPLIFPNHERRFKLMTNLITGGLLFYGVLFMDFGRNEHCFSPIRRYVFGKFKNILSVQPSDEVYLESRVDNIRAQIAQVDAEKQNQMSRN